MYVEYMRQGLCSQELYYHDYIILLTHYYYPYVVSPNSTNFEA